MVAVVGETRSLTETLSTPPGDTMESLLRERENTDGETAGGQVVFTSVQFDSRAREIGDVRSLCRCGRTENHRNVRRAHNTHTHLVHLHQTHYFEGF